MRQVLSAGCVVLALVAAADRAAAAVAVIPDITTAPFFAAYGTGDATVTYDNVVFSESAAISPSAILFNVSPGFSGAAKPVLSSQIGAPDNILITLPYAVTSVSFGYATFGGSEVDFALSNGNTYAFSPAGGGYDLNTVFAVSGVTPFSTIQLTSVDLALSIGDVTYGDTVPEPATWALLIAGFGLTGIAARRRVARAA